jgi:hypothetical protein
MSLVNYFFGFLNFSPLVIEFSPTAIVFSPVAIVCFPVAIIASSKRSCLVSTALSIVPPTLWPDNPMAKAMARHPRVEPITTILIAICHNALSQPPGCESPPPPPRPSPSPQPLLIRSPYSPPE